MNGNVRKLVFLLMIFSIMIFIFSGCDIISDFFSSSGGGSGGSDINNPGSDVNHILRNWDFDDPETYDVSQDYLINSSSEIKKMINGFYNRGEDIIPGWMDYEDTTLYPPNGIRIMDSHYNSSFRIGIGDTYTDSGANNDFLILYENRNVSDSNTIEIKMAQNLDYYVKSNSVFRIRVKFKSASDGGANYPFLFVNASINGTSYNLFAASPDNSNKWPQNYNVVDTGIDQWTEYGVNLDRLDVVNPAGVWDNSYRATHYIINNGDHIESITVVLAFHSAETYIDYIDIYEK